MKDKKTLGKAAVEPEAPATTAKTAKTDKIGKAKTQKPADDADKPAGKAETKAKADKPAAKAASGAKAKTEKSAGKPEPVAKAKAEKPKEPKKALNFKVSAEFRRAFKSYASAHDMKLGKLLEVAFESYRKQNGG